MCLIMYLWLFTFEKVWKIQSITVLLTSIKKEQNWFKNNQTKRSRRDLQKQRLETYGLSSLVKTVIKDVESLL